MQLYREEARYLERTAPWIERVGLDARPRAHRRRRRQSRKALYARFLYSQKFSQNDPWAERAPARRRAQRVRAAGGARSSHGRELDRNRRAGRYSRARRARACATGDGDIAVFRTERRRGVRARDRCPHKGGPLSQGIVHGKRVTCPLHNWVIDLATGEAIGRRTRDARARIRPRWRTARCGCRSVSARRCRRLRRNHAWQSARRAPIAASAAACWPAAMPRAPSRSAAIRSIPPISAGCARRASALGGDARSRRPPARPR